MKKAIKTFAIIALAVVIGLAVSATFAACDDGSPGGGGGSTGGGGGGGGSGPNNWIAVADSTFGTTSISDVAYGGGMWVVGGGAGKGAYSADNGVTWTAIPGSSFSGGLAYGGGRFVAGYDSIYREDYDTHTGYSDDGINWTTVGLGVIFDSNVHDIAYSNNRFVAVAYGVIAYSQDGANWTAVTNTPFGNRSISNIAWGNNRFVATGENGKIAYCNW